MERSLRGLAIWVTGPSGTTETAKASASEEALKNVSISQNRLRQSRRSLRARAKVGIHARMAILVIARPFSLSESTS